MIYLALLPTSFTFIPHSTRVFHSNTRTFGRLLSPCFKTGGVANISSTSFGYTHVQMIPTHKPRVTNRRICVQLLLRLPKSLARSLRPEEPCHFGAFQLLLIPHPLFKYDLHWFYAQGIATLPPPCQPFFARFRNHVDRAKPKSARLA